MEPVTRSLAPWTASRSSLHSLSKQTAEQKLPFVHKFVDSSSRVKLVSRTCAAVLMVAPTNHQHAFGTKQTNLLSCIHNRSPRQHYFDAVHMPMPTSTVEWSLTLYLRYERQMKQNVIDFLEEKHPVFKQGCTLEQGYTLGPRDNYHHK